MTDSPDRPAPSPAETVETFAELAKSRQEAVHSLLAAAAEADGVDPVSEHVVLRLRARAGIDGIGGQHLLLEPDHPDGPLGYAYREDVAAAGGALGHRDLELVIHPRFRRAGRGRLLVLAAAAAAPEGGVQVWSHGDHPGARALAADLGYRAVRTLLQWRRPLAGLDQLGEPQWPDGVTLRSFRPGPDDAEWLRLNARAFAHHPEQGRMTQADLDDRKGEPWFDPDGFLIAEQDGTMVGFHWTKIHPDRLGEVYVVGVSPDRHGGGLGRALTLAGLRYLADQGLATVLLYVESDNAPALAVYRRLGFSSWITDVMYASSGETSG